MYAVVDCWRSVSSSGDSSGVAGGVGLGFGSCSSCEGGVGVGSSETLKRGESGDDRLLCR